MWNEICDLIPLTSGLDMCIDNDIGEYERCARNCELKGMTEAAKSYKECADDLRNRKRELDNMNPLARWWHDERQYRRTITEHNKVIKDCKRRLGI